MKVSNALACIIRGLLAVIPFITIKSHFNRIVSDILLGTSTSFGAQIFLYVELFKIKIYLISGYIVPFLGVPCNFVL